MKFSISKVQIFYFGILYCVFYVCTVSVRGFPLYSNYTLDIHSSNGQVTTLSWYDFFD
ncbi:MAG: hypothetical protein HC854_18235 [Flavobacterium sp.]|nr:hypothetical protein [Flavobacterium sp.]